MGNNVYGVDLGTCNFKVFSKANGRVYQQKDAIAVVGSDQIYAYGDDAYEMYEKAPENIRVLFPVTSGVIADCDFLQEVLFDFIDKKLHGHGKGASFVVAVPTAITDVQKRAFFELFYKSRLRPKSVLLVEKPVADAVGLGLDVNQPTGVLIVDLGGDTTEISVLSIGGLVISELLNFGGNRLDEAIVGYIRKEFNLLIGQKSAKELKETIGSGMPGREEKMTVVGRNVVTGLPIEAQIGSDVIYAAISPQLENICTSVKMILERTPPEAARDIMHNGLYVTGGGAQLQGIGDLFAQITGIPVNLAEDPQTCCVRGLVQIVSDPKLLRLTFSISENPLH